MPHAHDQDHDDTQQIRQQLAGAGAYIASLPEPDRRIAQLAAAGTPLWAIANETGQAEAAVAATLRDILAAVGGRPVSPVTTGGMGSDTDPGIHGGYGETGFGSLDTEPYVDNTEPEE